MKIRALHDLAPRTPRRFRLALLGAAGAAFVGEVVFATQGLSHAATDAFFCVGMAAATIAALLAGLCAESNRGARVAIAAGMCLYAVGDIAFAAGSGSLASVPVFSALCWLSLYPLMLVGMLLVIRTDAPGRQLVVWLEGGIVAFGVAAVGYELLEPSIQASTQASAVVEGNAVFPLLDLIALTLLIILGLGNRATMRMNFALLAAGLGVLFASDLISSEQVAAGTFTPGGVLDAGWPAAMVLMAASLQFRGQIISPRVLEGPVFYALMSGSLVLSMVLVWLESAADGNPVVLILAGLVPLLVMARLLLSLRINQSLADDNAAIIETAGTGIVKVDRVGIVVSINPAGAGMLGYRQDELIGRNAHDAVHYRRPNGSPYPASECRIMRAFETGSTLRVTDEVFVRKDGTSFPVHYTGSPIRERGGIVGGVLVFDDVTHQAKLEESLRFQADHDSLTGLFNRRHLLATAGAEIGRARRTGVMGALVLIDLDAFKFVNDSFGHPAGDRLLRQMAALIASYCRSDDLVARLGGDEFAIVMPDVSAEEALRTAQHLVGRIKRESIPTLSASAGAAAFDSDRELTADDLLVCADLALYEAKALGGGRAELYSGHRAINLTWVERIREAIANDRFVVYGQPIVDLATGNVAREELLIRMRGADGEVIQPAAFLPTAERFGLIGEIDRIMVANGLRLARSGRAVSVNISSRSLDDPAIVYAVSQSIAEGVDPALVCFEITETSAATNMQAAISFADRVRQLGCSLALDDFGTGFGSLTYLRHLPVDYIKIDMDFVRDLPHSESDRHLVRALVSLAASLGQQTVAEGVESPGVVGVLRELGVDYAQGYLFGKPAEVDLGSADLALLELQIPAAALGD